MPIVVMLDLPQDSADIPPVRHLMTTALRAAGTSPGCVEEPAVAEGETCSRADRRNHAGPGFEIIVRIDDNVTVQVKGAGGGVAQRGPPCSPGGRPATVTGVRL